MRPRIPRGFTLLEVLVVLMITGMVSAILFQGLGSVLAIRTSVAATVLDLRSLILQRAIILDPVRGLIPDRMRGKHLFHGEERVLRGLTIRPLGEAAGAPRPFELAFDYDSAKNMTQLVYRGEADDPPQLVASWPGGGGRFIYRGLTGDWRESWREETNRDAQIPWLIGIETGLEANETLIAYIGSPHERRARPQDIGIGSGEMQ